MVRSRRKRRSDVYRTDFSRISVYPQFQRPEQNKGLKRLEPGDVVRVRVSGLDDDGRPTAVFKGYTIVIDDGSVEPGAEVKVRIERVAGRVARGRIAEE